jgi:hypothetical protein
LGRIRGKERREMRAGKNRCLTFPQHVDRILKSEEEDRTGVEKYSTTRKHRR